MASVKAKVDIIKQAIDRGVRGNDLVRIIKQKLTKADLRIASPILNPILKETNALALPTVQTEEYKGASFQVHQEHRRTAHVEKISQEDVAIRKMTRRLTTDDGRYSRENAHGSLKDQVRTSFLEESESQLDQVRKSHEGLSRHLYVDVGIRFTDWHKRL